MGIIQKQAIKGTVYSYIGVVIGFFTTAILFPLMLDPDEIGLLRLLVAFAVLFAQFGSLGFYSVLNRLFPYFRKPSDKHQGFIAFAMLVSVAGFILTSIAFELYKPVLIRNNAEDSRLLLEYLYLIIPLIFVTLFFNLFDTYNKVLYDTVLGTFLKEFLQRLLILISVSLYYFDLLSLQGFVIAYVISLTIPTLTLFVVLIYRGEITLRFDRTAFSRPVLREMGIISAFGFIAGLGGLAVNHVDSLLVNKFLGISATGIYTIAAYFGTLILIPSRPLIKISTTILAESWKSNDIDNIKLVYKKSCINQAILGILLFIGIWVNIHNIFEILPEEYRAGKYVIFFIALANVIEMSAGVSGMVIGTSKYYRLNAVFTFIFFLLIVGLNFIFIPLFGMIGAAITWTVARLVFVSIRYAFLRYKYKLEPYDYRYLLLLLIGIVSYLSVYFLPEMQNFVVDILIRSSIVLLVFSILVLSFKISEDVNKIWKNLIPGKSKDKK
ncbi:MAG: lipopolysaccharide biosynthesis protein [Bacteroidales bacterium]